jgi:Zn-dependent M16 (insulinase) family peptidase
MIADGPLRKGFTLVSSTPYPELRSRIVHLRHDETGLHFVVAGAPGPLCHATFVVPTLSRDDAGHPHCLEHLVFRGSHLYPSARFLEACAARCLSTGTNAWTDAEVTAYTGACAGGPFFWFWFWFLVLVLVLVLVFGFL